MQESHVAILHHLSHILFMDESVFHDLKVLWETLCNPMQKRLEINARLYTCKKHIRKSQGKNQTCRMAWQMQQTTAVWKLINAHGRR